MDLFRDASMVAKCCESGRATRHRWASSGIGKHGEGGAAVQQGLRGLPLAIRPLKRYVGADGNRIGTQFGRVCATIVKGALSTHREKAIHVGKVYATCTAVARGHRYRVYVPATDQL